MEDEVLDPAATETPDAPPAPAVPTPGADVGDALEKEMGGAPPIAPRPPKRDPDIENSRNTELSPPSPSEDASPQLVEHVQKGHTQQAVDELEQEVGVPAPDGARAPGTEKSAMEAPAEPAPGEPVLNPNNPIGAIAAPPEQKAMVPPKSVVLDVVRGFGEVDIAVVQGMRNAVQSVNTAVAKMSDQLRKYVPKWMAGGYSIDLTSIDPGETGHWLSKEEWDKYREDPKMQQIYTDIPETPDPKSVTGKMVSGMAQFATGFAMAGSLTGLTGRGVAAGLAKGFIGDALAFEGQSKNLMNLMEENADFGKAAFHLLATNPDDSEGVNRFKNALLGLGLGAGTEALIKLTGMGIRAIQKGQAIDGMARIIGTAKGTPIEPREIHAFETEGLKGPLEKATENVKDVMPSDVKGRSKAGPTVKQDWDHFLTEDGVKTVMKKMSQRGQALGVIDEARRGVRSNEVTEAAASKIDIGQLVLDHKPGTAYNAEQTRALDHLYVGSGESSEAAVHAAAAVPSEANLLIMRQRLAIHTMVENAYRGGKAEFGRTGQILSVLADAGQASNVSKALETLGGGASALDLANSLTKLTKSSKNKEAFDALVRSATKFGDASGQIVVNGLLGTATIGVKLSSDMANSLKQLVDRRVAARIGEKLGTEGAVHASEAITGAHSMISTIQEGLYSLAQRWGTNWNPGFVAQTGEEIARTPADFFNAPRKVVEEMAKDIPFGGMEAITEQGGALSAKYWNQEGSNLGKVLDIMDAATRVPGRIIGDIHNFSWMMNYRAELGMQATRQVHAELTRGLISPENFQKRINEIMANVPEEMHKTAKEFAATATFTNDPAPALKKLGNAIQGFPILGRLMLPFKVIPANILTQTLEGTPMAPFIGSWRQELMAGGAKADIALARVATGSALLSMSMDMAFRGLITGKAPEGPGQKENFKQLGGQEYSFNLPGGARISFERLGTLGFLMGMGADIASAIVNADEKMQDHDFEKVLGAGAFSVANNVLHKTYMMSLSQLVTALESSSSGENKVETFMQHMAAMAVPSTMATMTRLSDPLCHTADSMMQAIFRRIPGFSKDLPLCGDRWGEPVDYRSPAGAMYDTFSPYWLKAKEVQPIDTEMDRIKYTPEPLKHVARVYQLGNKSQSVALDGVHYAAYKQMAGNGLKDPGRGGLGCRDFLNSVVTGQNPDWSPVYEGLKKMDEETNSEGAKTFIRATIEDYRKKAAQKLFESSGKLQTDYRHKVGRSRQPSTGGTDNFQLKQQ